MKNLVTKAALFVICLAAFSTVGTAIYRWLTLGDKVACTANEHTFGCSTVLGWVLSALVVLVVVGGIYLWEGHRDK